MLRYTVNVSEMLSGVPQTSELSLPEMWWCPRCGIHSRNRGNVVMSKLSGVCPVCEDDLAREAREKSSAEADT